MGFSKMQAAVILGDSNQNSLLRTQDFPLKSKCPSIFFFFINLTLYFAKLLLLSTMIFRENVH